MTLQRPLISHLDEVSQLVTLSHNISINNEDTSRAYVCCIVYLLGITETILRTPCIINKCEYIIVQETSVMMNYKLMN